MVSPYNHLIMCQYETTTLGDERRDKKNVPKKIPREKKGAKISGDGSRLTDKIQRRENRLPDPRQAPQCM